MTAVRLFLHASSGAAWVIAGAALLWLSIHRNAPRRAADAWASVASVALVIALATRAVEHHGDPGFGGHR